MRRRLAVLLLAASACSSSTAPNSLTVVSQNLYLGGDIFSVVAATSAEEAAVATYDLWQFVQSTNFPARAKVLAAGIAAQNPDVIGLQEVAIWRTGDPAVCLGDLAAINTPLAGNTVYDFLDLLQAELRALGQSYDVARSTQSFDAELCAFKPGSGAAPIDVRYTDRDVILVRSGLTTANAAGGLYQVFIPFPIPGTGDPGVSVPDHRAWNVVEVQKAGQWYRVFETHLEIQEIPQAQPYGYVFQLAQAGELVATQVKPRGAVAPMPTLLLGDMNTQAEQPGGSPLRTTYNFLAQGLPFPDVTVVPWWPTALVGTVSPLADAWTQANPGQPGLTWGFDDDLQGGTMSQRIDLVLGWGAGAASMQVFGGTATTATTPPLHGSDHLGVAATMQVQ